jgi:hypothetical protein
MTDDPLLGHNESHYPTFRNDRAVSVQMHRWPDTALGWRKGEGPRVQTKSPSHPD